MKNTLTLILFSYSFLANSCCDSRSEYNPMKWSVVDGKLYEDSIREGHIWKRSSYFLDSSILSMQTYFENGNINKWFRYSRYYKEGEIKIKKAAIALFDSLGNFNTLKGFFLLNCTYYRDNTLVIETINPPVEHIVIGLRDSINGSIVFEDAFFATRTDTTAWVDFRNIQLKRGHSYIIDFMVLDKNKELVATFSDNQDLYLINLAVKKSGSDTVMFNKKRVLY